MYKYLTIVLAVLILSGCASKTPTPNYFVITYDSIPSGAMIYRDKNALGIAPIKLRYNITDKARYKNSPPQLEITAVWPSGAESTETILIRPGQQQTFTFSRPRNAIDLDKDLAYAEKYNQMQEEKSRNVPSYTAAILELFSAAAKGYSKAKMASYSNYKLDDSEKCKERSFSSYSGNKYVSCRQDSNCNITCF